MVGGIAFVLAATAFGQPGGVVAVVARGVGTDAEAAKRDAIVNAVQQVVGMYVDAETLVRDEAVVREKVLTFANADVRGNTVLSVARRGELWEAMLRVEVVRNSLTERLKSNRVAVREIAGDRLAELFG